MARKLLVEIVGDASSLERSLRSAGHEAEGFGSKLGHVAKTAALVGGAAALGGLAIVLDKSVHAALEGQAAQAALDQALRNTHQSVKAMTPALDAANAAARQMGFTDVQSETALARLETATGSTTKAIQDEGVAMDIARFKHTDLTNASQMLAMAMTGSQRAAKQLGITVIPVTANMDALKASHENLATAAGKADEAQAKLADKMATGQAVIDAVTAKVHGQAKAYAETAAGGMATFSAQIEFMEQKLGNALLPALVSVMTWVNAHWPQIQAVFDTTFHAIGKAIDFVKPYIADFIAASQRVVDRVRADWPQISADVTKAMNTIRDIINAVVTVAQAIWSRFGNAITEIARRNFTAIIAVVRDAAHVIEGVVQLVADVLHGRWGAAWDDAKKIVSNTLAAITTIITAEIKNAYTAALAIGRAIIDGIGAGISGLASSIAGKLKDAVGGAISSVKGAFGIHSPSTVTQKEIGEPLAAGVILGFVNGIGTFGPKASAALSTQIGFVSADARRGMAEVITTVEGAWVKVSATLGKIQSAAMAATQYKTASGAPLSDWIVQNEIQASLAANPNASTGGLMPGSFDPSLWDIPSMSGGNTAPNVVVNMPNYLGTLDDAADAIQRALLRKGLQGGTVGLA